MRFKLSRTMLAAVAIIAILYPFSGVCDAGDEPSSAPIAIELNAAARDAAAGAAVHYHILRARTDAGARAPLNAPAMSEKFAGKRPANAGLLAAVPSPGFYPAQLANSDGRTIQRTALHNVYLGSTDGSPWGNPLGFEKDLVKSRFMHLIDQYVGATDKGRYSVGSEFTMGAVADNCSSASMCTYGDILAIALAASAQGGAGPGHIYHIFLPQNVDTCAPGIGCYSPDDLATFTFCGYHASTMSGNQTTYFTVEPFQNVPGCAVAVSDLSAQLAFSTDSVLSHEIFETLSDPDGNAWLNVNSLNELGSEIGDECQGPGDASGDAIVPSVPVNGRNYRIQLEYSNKYRACAAMP